MRENTRILVQGSAMRSSKKWTFPLLSLLLSFLLSFPRGAFADLPQVPRGSTPNNNTQTTPAVDGNTSGEPPASGPAIAPNLAPLPSSPTSLGGPTQTPAALQTPLFGADVKECKSYRNQARFWGAMAAGLAVAAGAGGFASGSAEQKGTRALIGVFAMTVGASSAASSYLASDYNKSYQDMCTIQNH